MTAAIEGADVTYEASFLRPVFDLRTKLPAVFESYYGNVGSFVSLEHMRMYDGEAVADVRGTISMFGGNGVVELNATKLTATFRQLQNERDFRACADCISSAKKALGDGVPNAVIRITTWALTLDLSCDSVNASDCIYRIVNLDRHSLRDFGQPALSPRLNFDLRNDDEGWESQFIISPNVLDQSKLFAGCAVQFEEKKASRTLTEQSDHVRALTSTLLGRVGVDIPDSVWLQEDGQ